MGVKETEGEAQTTWDLGEARFLLALDVRGRVFTLSDGWDERALVRRDLEENAREFLERAKLPSRLRAFLGAHSYAHWVGFGHCVWTETHRLRDANEHVGNAGCLRDRLLVVGSAVNGDPIVLDLATGLMGFVHHDLAWEDRELEVRAAAFVATPLDFGSFWLAAALLPYRGHEESDEPDDDAAGVDSANQGPDALCFPSDAYGAESMTPGEWTELTERLTAFERAERAAQEHVSRALDAYAAYDWTTVQTEARAAYDMETTDTTWAAAVTLLTWLSLAGGAVANARAWLDCMPTRARPHDLVAFSLALLEGQPIRARKFAAGLDEGAYGAWGPLVEGLAAGKRRDLLVRLVAPETLELVPTRVIRRVVDRLFRLGAYGACKRVLTWLFEREGNPQDAYNLACTASRAESPREGLDWLERALAHGFSDLALVATDEDLAPLRALTKYAALATTYGVPLTTG